jgi:hypothetical protein
MIAKCILATVLSATSCFVAVANTVAVFACSSKPTSGTDCLSRDLANGKTLNIGKDDYYDILIKSVCIDQPDSWWHQKLISLTATVTLASSPTPVKMPVYNERATGSGCRIGINDFALYTSVPANGTPVALQVDVLRSNSQNGLKQLLSFATSQESNPAITTYAASAVPFLNLGLSFANSVYSAFGQSNTPEIPMTPTTLTPTSGLQLNSNDLRDSYLVEYSGPANPQDRDFYLDSGGDLRWSKDDTYVRGAAWVVLRIQKREHRTDYVLRAWYKQWYALLEQVAQGAGGGTSVTVAAYQKTTSDCIALLEADGDFTDGDKHRFISDYTTVEASIAAELGKPTPNYVAIDAAIQAALDSVDLIQPVAGHAPVTATNSAHPTAVPAPNTNALALRAVVPSRLAQELRTRLQP